MPKPEKFREAMFGRPTLTDTILETRIDYFKGPSNLSDSGWRGAGGIQLRWSQGEYRNLRPRHEPNAGRVAESAVDVHFELVVNFVGTRDVVAVFHRQNWGADKRKGALAAMGVA